MSRCLSLGLLLIAFAARAAEPEFEAEPTDPKLAKIVVVAAKPSHKPGEHEFYAGSIVLHKLLQQTPGVFPVLVKDGWPTNPKTFENAKAVVFFVDGGGEQAILKGDHPKEMQKLVDAGVGIVHLHTAIDYPKDFTERAIGWMGGVYEPKFSKRAHWIADFKEFPEHAITRGVKPFKIDDGWLTNSRFTPELKGVTPLLRTAPPKNPPATTPLGNDAIVSWAYERPNGGRSFVFTGGHLHSSFSQEGYRRYLTNAILWSAKLDVPKDGAPVELDPAELTKNLERKAAEKSK